jgi:type IV pilus assembly protein PilC
MTLFFKKILSSLRTLGYGNDREYLIDNLSMLVNSGLPVADAVGTVAEGLETRGMRTALEHVRAEIESGTPLSTALSHTGLFPTYTLSLIRFGEESGNLGKNLRAVSLQQHKDRIFSSRIRSAMLYPTFVLTLTLIVGLGIAWFILPRLAQVFANLKVTLPAITKVLIAGGQFLDAYGSIAIPGFLLCFIASVYLLFYFPPTKHLGQSILLVLPGIKLLILEAELARFGYIFGTLLQAGLPITEALRLLAQSSGFRRYTRFYTYLSTSIEDGNSFAKSFSAYPDTSTMVPRPVQQLIESAEQSGTLAEAFLQISTAYEEKSETTSKNVSTLMEPILLVLVWLGVVCVALAVILPIYSLVGGLKT